MPELDFTILPENLFFLNKAVEETAFSITSFSTTAQARSLRLFLGALVLRERLESHNSSISLGPK